MRKVPVPIVTSFRLNAALHKGLNDLAAKKSTRPGKLIRRAVQEMVDREMLAEALSGMKVAA